MYGDGCSTGLVRCSECKETMPALDFNVHDCKYAVEPLDGESWDDFKARATKIREEMKAKGL